MRQKRDKTKEKPKSIRFNDDYIRYAGWVASEWRKAKIITPEKAVQMYKKAIKAVNKHQGLQNKYDGKGNLRVT